MGTISAIRTGGAIGQKNVIYNRPDLLSAAAGFVAGLAIFVILRIIKAEPFAFLLLVGNLLACFGGGLIMRMYWAEDRTQRRKAMLYGMLIPPISVAVGMVCGVILSAGFAPLGAMFGGDGLPQEVAALGALLLGALAATLIGGAATGAFSSVAAIPYLFLSIPLALYFTWIIGPMISTVYIAMTNWEGVGLISDARFLGFENFDRLFRDRNFGIALGNNIKWLLFFLLIPTTMGLGLAMIFNNKFPGARIFKIAFFAPLIIAPTVVAIVWSAMYLPETGLIDAFLKIFTGPETKLPAPRWLANPALAIWCIIFAAGWRQVGYVMILYLAGLKSLDISLLEAATVDGATPWERFRFVIFPLLGPVTVVVVVISVIDSLRAFDLVAVMTRGGPAFSSEVLANFMYLRAFNDYRMGYGAAIAVVLLVLMLFFIVPYLIRVARTELEY